MKRSEIRAFFPEFILLLCDEYATRTDAATLFAHETRAFGLPSAYPHVSNAIHLVFAIAAIYSAE
jgi:hypothetical protein